MCPVKSVYNDSWSFGGFLRFSKVNFEIRLQAQHGRQHNCGKGLPNFFNLMVKAMIMFLTDLRRMYTQVEKNDSDKARNKGSCVILIISVVDC